MKDALSVRNSAPARRHPDIKMEQSITNALSLRHVAPARRHPDIKMGVYKNTSTNKKMGVFTRIHEIWACHRWDL